jgi:hypothetical protein
MTTTIVDLPDDMLMEIFRYIPPEEAILISQVCKRFNACWWKERRVMSLKYVQEKMKEGRMDLIEYCGGKRMREVFDIYLKRTYDDDICSCAAMLGCLEVLKWLRENDCPWDHWTCTYAAKGGHFDVLTWASANGCPWSALTCAYAAKGGHLKVLQWLRENGCPWDKCTCDSAAKGGHLEVLQWLTREEDPCPWDEWTCENAAQGGHLEVLQWLRENGCPWNEWTCLRAAENGPEIMNVHGISGHVHVQPQMDT